MTEKVLDWLNHNRFRAYPFVNDDGLLCNGTRVPDCILLDCMMIDMSYDTPVSDLVFTEFEVDDNSITVSYSYGGVKTVKKITGDESKYAKDAITSRINVVDSAYPGGSLRTSELSLTLSTPEYIIGKVGKGKWSFNGRIIPTKVVKVPTACVTGIRTNGSAFVEGFDKPGIAKGDVHLVDGFRTQPVITNGKVLVKVGTSYGYDPCHYKGRQEHKTTACSDLLMFFCGQNAVNSGNVVLSGGPGVDVTTGVYTAKADIPDSKGSVGISAGEVVPCIELIASPELKRLWKPVESPDGNQQKNVI